MLTFFHWLFSFFRKKKRLIIYDELKRIKPTEIAEKKLEYIEPDFLKKKEQKPKKDYLNFRKQQLEGKVYRSKNLRIRIGKKVSSNFADYFKYEISIL